MMIIRSLPITRMMLIFLSVAPGFGKTEVGGRGGAFRPLNRPSKISDNFISYKSDNQLSYLDNKTLSYIYNIP